MFNTGLWIGTAPMMVVVGAGATHLDVVKSPWVNPDKLQLVVDLDFVYWLPYLLD